MKITVREDFRVVIAPVTPHGRLPAAVLEANLEKQCREIKWQAERHIDGMGGVQVQWTTRTMCSHCEAPWEVLSAEDIAKCPEFAEEPGDGPGLPVCCNAAQVEWRAAQAGVIA
jgi:hypothetical protein